MKLRTAFFLSLLGILVVMAVPALFGVGHVREVRSIAVGLRERSAEAAFTVGRIQADLERLDRYQRAYVATGDPQLAERVRDALDAVRTDVALLRDGGYGQAVDAAGPPIADIRSLVTLTELLMQAGHEDAATELLRAQLAPLVAEAANATGVLASAVDDVTGRQLERVERITSRAVTTTTAALLGALLAAAALAAMAARFLTRPLNRLSTAMATVADGDFEPPATLPYDRPDEVGELLRAFRSMALQLGDLNRMKAQFLSIASHDLKTPVNVVSGYAELLSEELGDTAEERHREVLDALSRQARTLSTRINQLLEVSRIEASGLRLGLEEINVRHFAAELVRAYAARAERNGIAMETEVDDSAPSFFIADPDCLRGEVFANLLDNALRFTPRGGHIRLRASGAGGLVHFELADDGPPIPAEALAHAFDRYYRGPVLAGRIGSGLGLPLAQAGVEAHGGAITVESGPGVGTLFHITLPIHPALPSGPDSGDLTEPA